MAFPLLLSLALQFSPSNEVSSKASPAEGDGQGEATGGEELGDSPLVADEQPESAQPQAEASIDATPSDEGQAVPTPSEPEEDAEAVREAQLRAFEVKREMQRELRELEQAKEDLERARDERDEISGLSRSKRTTVAFGSGISSCPQPFCTYVLSSLMARFEVGYRFNNWALAFPVEVGGAPIFSNADLGIKSGHTFAIRGGVVGEYHLPIERAFDPYLHVGMGYTNHKVELSGEDDSFSTRFTSPFLRVGGGIDFFRRESFSVGPRFDKDILFLGKVCNSSDCRSFKEVFTEELSDPVSKRLSRKEIPDPWSLTLMFRFLI